MPTLITSAVAASTIGASVRTVQRLAAEHGIGQQLGRVRVFSRADIEQLRKRFQGGPGCPD